MGSALIILAVVITLGLLSRAYERIQPGPPVKPGQADDSDTGRRL